MGTFAAGQAVEVLGGGGWVDALIVEAGPDETYTASWPGSGQQPGDVATTSIRAKPAWVGHGRAQNSTLQPVQAFLDGQENTNCSPVGSAPVAPPMLGQRVSILVDSVIDADNTVTGSVMSYLDGDPRKAVLLLDRCYRHHCIAHHLLPTFLVPLAQETYASSDWQAFVRAHADNEGTHGAWTMFDDDGKRQAYVEGNEVQFLQCSGGSKYAINGLVWKATGDGEEQGELRANNYVTFKGTGAHGQVVAIGDDKLVSVKILGDESGSVQDGVRMEDLVKTPDKCMPLPASGLAHDVVYPRVQVFVGAVSPGQLEEFDTRESTATPAIARVLAPASQIPLFSLLCSGRQTERKTQNNFPTGRAQQRHKPHDAGVRRRCVPQSRKRIGARGRIRR